MPRREMVLRVQEAIRDYFTHELGRPELLNRLGDNIVVFDFITETVGAEILDLMIRNVCVRVRNEHGLEVTLSPTALKQLRQLCLSPGVLEFGGRGIGSQLETTLVNPLARAIFRDRASWGSKVEILEISGESELYEVTVA